MGGQRVDLVYGQPKRAANLVAGPGKDYLLHAAGSPNGLQEGDGSVNVLQHCVTRGLEGKGGVGLRRQVRNDAMALHVPWLNILNALPKVLESGMRQRFTQEESVGGRCHIHPRHAVALRQQGGRQAGTTKAGCASDQDTALSYHAQPQIAIRLELQCPPPRTYQCPYIQIQDRTTRECPTRFFHQRRIAGGAWPMLRSPNHTE